MDTKWGAKHRMVTIHDVERIEALSNHAPLLLGIGATKLHGKSPQFKFELGWLHRDGFADIVKEVWNNSVTGQSPIQRWSNKVRTLWKYLRGWACHTNGLYIKKISDRDH
jgi:hypothetical protein